VPQWLRDVILLIVTLTWAANLVAPIWSRDYKPPAELNGAFMAIVGVYFATRDKGNSKDKDQQ
jgi:hypothetical protein